MSSFRTIGVVILWLFVSPARADILLVNGSFETENAFTANYTFSNLNSFSPSNINPNAVTGWYISSTQSDIATWINIQDGNTTFVLNRDGARYGFINAGMLMETRGADRQSILGGQSLRLDFLLSNDVLGSNANVTIGLQFFADTNQASTPMSSVTQVITLPGASSPRQLTAYSLLANAPASSSFLGVSVQTFRPAQGINQLLFDDFRVTAVPEPNSVVLLSVAILSLLLIKRATTQPRLLQFWSGIAHHA
jgi:hypothetical protein